MSTRTPARHVSTSSPLPSVPSPSVVPSVPATEVGIIKTVDHQLIVNPNLSPANRTADSDKPAMPSIDSHPGSHSELPQLTLASGKTQPDVAVKTPQSKVTEMKSTNSSPSVTPPGMSRTASGRERPCVLSPASSLHRSNSLLHLRGTNKKLVLGMVGLPARGKTYIAQKLSRYLNWCSYSARVFNIGVYRRKLFGAHQSADWFDAGNEEGVSQRTQCAMVALKDMFDFFHHGGGQAAIYDGTNTTVERRAMVSEYIASQAAATGMIVELVWIESIVYDQSIVTENIRENKLSSPDYDHMDTVTATNDFLARINNYDRYYEPLPVDSDQPYVKIIDQGRQIHTNKIVGYLMSKIVFFLMNLRVNRAPIFISRHGESQHNVLGLIGGDSELSESGVRYAKALAKFIESEEEFNGSDGVHQLTVWTSTMKRTIQTASHFNLPITQWRALIEIQVGVCDSMSYEEIAERYPLEADARKKDKLRYRYPQGESYLDVIQRLEPCILELERMQSPVLLIVHRAVARCLLSYFMDIDQVQIPHLEVPLHTVMKLQPKAYRCEVTQFAFPIPSVDLPSTKGT